MRTVISFEVPPFLRSLEYKYNKLILAKKKKHSWLLTWHKVKLKFFFFKSNVCSSYLLQTFYGFYIWVRQAYRQAGGWEAKKAFFFLDFSLFSWHDIIHFEAPYGFYPTNSLITPIQKVCQVCCTCWTWLKNPLSLAIFQKNIFCIPSLTLIHGFTHNNFSKCFWIFTKPLISCFQSIPWFWV